MTRTIVGSVAILLLVVAALAAVGFAKFRQITAAINTPPPIMPPTAVTLAPAESIVFRRSATTVGSILAPQSITLRTELTGSVAEIPMQPGSVVDKDDVLIRLDTSVEEAELRSAQAAFDIAASTLRRLKNVSIIDAITEQELDQAAAAAAQAAAETDRLRAIIDKKTLTAPFRARVGLFNVHLGQYLPEGTSITTLQGIEDYLHVDFAMPQHVADEVQVGDAVELMLPATDMTARIIAVDSQADLATRAVNARARLEQPPASLQPNDSVKLRIEYGSGISAIAVPATSLRRSPTGTHVFIAVAGEDGQMHAEAREVRVASNRGNVAAILGGVAPGETVIADGSFKIQEKTVVVGEPAASESTVSESTVAAPAGSPDAAAPAGLDLQFEPVVETSTVGS